MEDKISKIKPRGLQVLIKPDGEKSRVSEYGLSAPENDEQEERATGVVISVGKKVAEMDDSERINPGDKVVFGVFAGDDIEVDNEDYKLVDEEHVLAFLE